MEDKRLVQLRANAEYLAATYLNGQMDCGEEQYPNFDTAKQCVDYCKQEIFDMKVTDCSVYYAKNICGNLKFLGNDAIHIEIVKAFRNEGLFNF